MRNLCIKVILYFYLTIALTVIAQTPPPTPPPEPPPQVMEPIVVRPDISVLEGSGGGLSFWGWLYQLLTYQFESPTEIDFLCENISVSGENGARITSDTPADQRLAATNALVQARFQGLGGNGRPFSARIVAIYADGGTEAFIFVGTSSTITAVANTLIPGSGIPSTCKPN